MTMRPVTPGERIDVLDALRVYENGQLRRFCMREEFPRTVRARTGPRNGSDHSRSFAGTHPAETTGRRSR